MQGENLSQKLGGHGPKTVGKLRPISSPDLGDRSHCFHTSWLRYMPVFWATVLSSVSHMMLPARLIQLTDDTHMCRDLFATEIKVLMNLQVLMDDR